MKPRHMLLAAMTAVIWGLAFVATKLGLESFSAPQLTALRFLIACLPVLVVPRPRIGWGALVLIGLTLFAGQFLLLFFAFEAGLAPGLASVTQQMQVFLTVLLSAAFLARIIHEKCAIKAKPLISLTTMRMGCLMKFFAMKFLAQVFGGLGRFRAVR